MLGDYALQEGERICTRNWNGLRYTLQLMQPQWGQLPGQPMPLDQHELLESIEMDGGDRGMWCPGIKPLQAYFLAGAETHYLKTLH